MQANSSVTPEELVAFKILRDHDAASKVTPSLLAYLETTQSANMPVPGGFLTYVVWQKVSGIQLGDNTGAATSFWKSFPKKEDRDPIQKAFMRTFNYWVGFHEWSDAAPKRDLRLLVWLAFFDMVKVPARQQPLFPDWNKDTSEWKW
ncbi:unnamed protein product [Penicillium manginii]